MLITNAIKVVGCLMMLAFVHPLIAYAVVGFGAAAYSPAKYGILTELLPPHQLVVANGWIEGTTVASIILGVLVGGTLISEKVSAMMLGFDIPLIDTGIETPPAGRDLRDRRLLRDRRDLQLVHSRHGRRSSRAEQEPVLSHPRILALRRRCSGATSWARSRSPPRRCSGARAPRSSSSCSRGRTRRSVSTCRRRPICRAWSRSVSRWAPWSPRRYITLRKSVNVLPIGVAMGLVVITMIFVNSLPVAVVLMIVIGGCAGFFVVPMNALLQHRGHVLMGAGHSIAVQNFNENIGILVMVGLYALMIREPAHQVNRAIVMFGVFMSAAMLLVLWRLHVQPVEGRLAAAHLRRQRRRTTVSQAHRSQSSLTLLRERSACRTSRCGPPPVRGECSASRSPTARTPCSTPSA